MTKPKVSLTVKKGDKVTKIADDINNLSDEGRALAINIIDTLNAPSDRTDLFQWANNIDAVKNDLDIELFLINKNYTPYSLRTTSELTTALRAFFLYDVINYVQLGAGTGLAVREYDSEEAQNVVLRQDVGAVGRLETLLYIIEESRDEIVEFNHDEHDLKRMKGIVARFSHPEASDGSDVHFVFKLLPATKFLAGASAWNILGGQAEALQGSALSIPSENHVLVVRGDAFVLNRKKFEQLFNYNYKLSKLAKEKGEILDAKYKINAAGTVGQGIEFVASEVKDLHTRLANVLPDDLMELDRLVEVVDEYGAQLMFDDRGGVILMNKDDVRTFLDLVEDNYVKGSIGKSYVAKKKKEIVQ